MNPELINNLIKDRRSIFPRSYTGEAIPKATVEAILESGNWAPTHKKTEPWRFKVFTGESLTKLGDFLSSLYKEITPAEKFSEIKFKKLKKNPTLASHVVAICMKRDEEERIPEVEEVCAVACAAQNMMLSAASYNVGSYWSSPGLVFSEEMKSFLQLGEKDKCLGLLYMGFHNMPKIDGVRKPIAEKVDWM